MPLWIFTLIVILHGLVHLLYVAFARGWLLPENGRDWTGQSWLFTPLVEESGTRKIGGWLYAIAMACFVIAGLSTALGWAFARSALIIAALFSSVCMLLMWDLKYDRLPDKGFIGLLINLALIASLLLFNFPEI